MTRTVLSGDQMKFRPGQLSFRLSLSARQCCEIGFVGVVHTPSYFTCMFILFTASKDKQAQFTIIVIKLPTILAVLMIFRWLCFYKLKFSCFRCGGWMSGIISPEWITANNIKVSWDMTHIIWFITNVGEVVSYLMMRTEMILETSVYSPFNHVTRLLAWKNLLNSVAVKKLSYILEKCLPIYRTSHHIQA